MEQKVLISGENCIIKNNFHIYEKSININEVDIRKIGLSNVESSRIKGAFKYFIGYIHKGKAFSRTIMHKTSPGKWIYSIF